MKFKFIILAVTLLFFACGTSSPYEPNIPEENSTFGWDQTFEVITWNLENFAKNGSLTVESVSNVLDSLNVDVIALQEIENSTRFNQLVEMADGWDGYRSEGAAYDINLAFLYRSEYNPTFFKILNNDWYAFPRTPLVMELEVMGEDLVIINNHFKAGGGDDNEARRLDACEKLHVYLNQNYPNSNMIVVGDMNDELTDSESSNVFDIFLDDTENFLFTDLALELAGVENYSYPGWPSHLDHILISDELFDNFVAENATVQTLQVDDYFINWDQYEENISDHLPVGIRLVFE